MEKKRLGRACVLICLLLLLVLTGISERMAVPQEKIHPIEEVAQMDTPEIAHVMEEDFGIKEVEFFEMDKEVAEKIYRGFSYMYMRYPCLYGKLGSVKVEEISSGEIAMTEYAELSSPKEGLYPMEMEWQIILGEREFLNPVRLKNIIRKSTAEGHWMADTNIEALVVHELTHMLVGQIRMERYGLKDFTYITKENGEAFAAYNTDILSINQTTAREIVENAYENYRNGTEISLEEARKSISGYAMGKQEDGGTSYEETIAEAMVDSYLHGENAGAFSKEIVGEIEKNWLFIPFPVSSVAKTTKN